MCTTVSGCHLHDRHDPRIIDGASDHLYLYLVGGICEVAFALIRRHEINEELSRKRHALSTNASPYHPVVAGGLGIAFGIIIGKEIFGGVGYNV